MLYNMIAMLPPDSRPKLEDLPAEPKALPWADDPDDQQYMAGAWNFVRSLSYKTEESVATYVANIQTKRSFS